MDAAPSVFDRVYPLTILVLLGLAVPLALLLINRIGSRWAVGKRDQDPGKHEPYECGLSAITGGAGDRFPVKFYLVAMLFLAFDVEVAFLYPWALHFSKGGWEMVGLLVAFLGLLEAAYLYLWRKGALDWDQPSSFEPRKNSTGAIETQKPCGLEAQSSKPGATP